jgi:hypothetical protein
MENSSIKRSHFRAWKAGKNWLYTSTALAVLGAGAAFGGQKSKADGVTDVQNQIALNSLASDATPVSKTEAAVAPAAQEVVTTSVQTSLPSSTVSSAAVSVTKTAASSTDTSSSTSPQALTSDQASALSAFGSALGSDSDFTSLMSAMNSAAATSSGAAKLASYTSSLSASLGSSALPIPSSDASILSSVFATADQVASEKSEYSSAISSAAQTSDMKSMLAAISAIPEDATISLAAAAIAAASSAGDSSAVASLQSSFYTNTSEGQEIMSLYTNFLTNTAPGQTVSSLSSQIAAGVNSISKTLGLLDSAESAVGSVLTAAADSSASQAVTDGVYTGSFLGMSGVLGDYVQSVLGATLGWTIGDFGGMTVSLPLGIITDFFAFFGYLPLNLIGLTLPGWFGQISGGYVGGGTVGAPMYTFGLFGSALGAYYGATGLFNGFSSQNATLTELGSALGAFAGGFIGYTAGGIVDVLINHLYWLAAIPGAFVGVVPILPTIEAALLAIAVPVTLGLGLYISGGVGIITAAIGALIGGAIGAIAQLLGLNINIPSFSAALTAIVKWTHLDVVFETVTNSKPQGSITLSSKTVAWGTSFKPTSLFVSAQDASGNTVDASNVTISGTVIPSRAGVYGVIFTFVDPTNGQTVTSAATWTVLAKGVSAANLVQTAPSTIQPSGSDAVNVKNVNLTVGQVFRASSGFVSATDINGNAVPSSAITVSGTVVSTKAGVYPVIYSFTDANGATVSNTAIVTVTPATEVVTA